MQDASQPTSLRKSAPAKSGKPNRYRPVLQSKTQAEGVSLGLRQNFCRFQSNQLKVLAFFQHPVAQSLGDLHRVQGRTLA